MNSLKPFWSYYGGKYRSAPKYPEPKYDTIIEPFAGAAGYSLRHFQKNIILVEKYDVIAKVWDYLISQNPYEVNVLPYVESVVDLPKTTPKPLQDLVGLCLSKATTRPKKSLSDGCRKWMSEGKRFEGWSQARKERIVDQMPYIRHWKIIQGDFMISPNIEATWFIDPPYQNSGKHYKHSSKDIDYKMLGEWCRNRKGQVIVCESLGADWLPFVPIQGGSVKAFGAGGRRQRSFESVWIRE